MEQLSDELTTLLVSAIAGAMLGIEREYQNKSAGLRTIVLICLGATLFTMVSTSIGGSDDRIAANIITGIGFIGAGVIFKDTFNVKGLTTAAVIWISAAIGMVIGIGEYKLGLLVAAAIVMLLIVFAGLETFLDRVNHRRVYRITLRGFDKDNIDKVRGLISENNLRSSVTQVFKDQENIVINLSVTGNKAHFHALAVKLVTSPWILSIEH